MAQRQYAIDRTLDRRSKTDEGDLVVKMAFASEQPYERWWGVEILEMAGARLDRLNDGAPLLYNHDWNDLRGTHVPGSVSAGDDGVLRGDARITAATQVGRDTIALVESGVLTKASVGYSIHKIIQQTTAKAADGSTQVIEREIEGGAFERLIDEYGMKRDRRGAGGDLQGFRRALDSLAGAVERATTDEPDIYRVVDWEPFENSLVTIPADNSVGIGRSAVQAPAPSPIKPVLQPAAPAATKGALMGLEQNAAAGTSADDKGTSLTAVQIEQERRKAIQDLVKGNRLDSRIEEKWIREGTPLSQVASEILDVLEERGKANPATAAELGLSTRETQRYSLFKAIRALHYGSKNPALINEAGFEIECSRAVAKQLGRGDSTSILVPSEVLMRPMEREVMQRAMSTTPGSKGGYLVNVENMGFIDILRNRSVTMNMGARRIPGLQGNVMFPRQTGKGTVTWQAGEAASTTATDQALGQLSMTPKTAIAITDVSEQLLRQSSPSAEAFVMADLASDIAIDGIDYVAINGSGGAQPLGIKNTTGVTTGQDASSATYAKVLAFVSTAAGANAIRGNPGFVTNAAGAAVLMQRSRFANTDTPLWDGNVLDGVCVGFRGMASEQLASGNLIFGSWDEVVIGEWGVLELSTDNGGTRFNQAQVGIRAMWMVDVMLRYPQAFVVGTNLS